MQININELADLISDKINTVPLPERLWSIRTIAQAFECGLTTAKNLTMRPDFPASYRFPTKSVGSQPRWLAADVLAWKEKFKGKNAQ